MGILAKLLALQCMLQPPIKQPLDFSQWHCTEDGSGAQREWICGACRGVRETFYGKFDQNGKSARSDTAMVEKPAVGKRLSIRSPQPFTAKCIFSTPAP